MKHPALLLTISFIFFVSSCQQAEKDKQEETEVEKTTTVQEPVTDETEIVKAETTVNTQLQSTYVEHPDSIRAFYNVVLKRLYPDRILYAQYEDSRIAVSPEAREDIEGGGKPTKNLFITDDNDVVVGTIIYATFEPPYPFTFSMAVLKEGNSLVNAMLTGPPAEVKLRIFSNKDANSNAGPYDCQYFTYSSTVNLQAIAAIEGLDAMEHQLSSVNEEGTVDDSFVLSNEDIQKVFEEEQAGSDEMP